ncbi:MAG: hypothetical protein ACXW18_09985 [Pyrinomonadaceae bacterium]
MKMKGVRYLILAVVLSMSFMTTRPASAGQPPMTHALIHLVNNSNAVATVYFKWGNGPWKRTVIEKGGAHYFNHRYEGQSRSSPNFFVRIDTDTQQGARIVEHVLSRGASPDDNDSRYGHHFKITQVSGTNTRYIQAVTPGATVRVTDNNSSTPNV